MRIVPLMAALVLAGCSNKDEEDTGEQEMLGGGGGDGTSECAGAAPVITSITCTNAGLDFLEGMGEVPWLAFEMQLDDEDGNLDSYRLEVYYDEAIDGAVVAADSPYTPYTGSPQNAEECETFTVPSVLSVPIPGIPATSTRYEWGFVLVDATGTSSEMATIACTTPAEDGTGEADPEET